MNGFPAKVVTLFAALATAGTVMVAIADRLAGGFHQTVLGRDGKRNLRRRTYFLPG